MKPKWEKWKGEKKADYEKRLAEWQRNLTAMPKTEWLDKITEADEQEAQEAVYQHVTKRACAKCALWVPNTTDNRGQCSLYPTWLITTASHYCGSWRKEI